MTVSALSVATPFFFFRYLAPVIPVLCLLAAGILEYSMRLHPALGVVALALIVAISPFRHFVDELTHRYRGPIEGIVEFLRLHAKDGDVVAVTYEDLPIKFYTDLRVVGGLTGEDLTPALHAKWVIIRGNIISEKDYAVANYLRTHLRGDDYRAVPLDCPDIPFQNRETPDAHLYRTVTGARPVVIFERIRD
jgi:hypothetical protein